MKLLYSSTSPYSAKVRMSAHYLGLDVASEPTKTEDAPAELVANNPLGKIPVLIRDGKPPVFDSVAIMQFFNRETRGRLYPRNPDKRTDAEILEALADGITDCLLAIVYEKRFHPPEKIHQPWIDRQWEKVVRGLDYLNAHLPKTNKNLHGGHFALALRFPGEWEKGHGKLKNWPQKFEKFFPEYQRFKPQS